MTSILEWMSPTRWIILLVLVLCIFASIVGFGLERYNAGVTAEHNRMQVEIDKVKLAAANELAQQTKKTLTLERKLADAQAKEAIDYEKRKLDTRSGSMALDRAAADHRGMFVDPNGRGCGREDAKGQVAASAGGGAVDAAGAGGELSVQLSDLLRDKLRKADDINDAYAICRADAVNMRLLLNEDGD